MNTKKTPLIVKKVLVIFLALTLVSVVAFFIFNQLDWTVAKIGDDQVTRKEVNGQIAKLEKYYRFFDESLSSEEAQKMARDQLVLHKALTKEAELRNVSVESSELETKFEQASKQHETSVEDFINLMNLTYGFDEEDLKFNYETEILKDKLSEDLIFSASVLTVATRWDIFPPENVDAQKFANDILPKLFESKYLSLIKSDNSAEEIIAEVNGDSEFAVETLSDYQNQIFFSGAYVVEDVNKTKDGNIFGDEDRWSEIYEFENVGDSSESVQRSSGGYYYLTKLIDRSDGDFDSWDQYINFVLDNEDIYGIDREDPLTLEQRYIATFYCNQTPLISLKDKILDFLKLNNKAYAQVSCTSFHQTGWSGVVTTTAGVAAPGVTMTFSVRPGYSYQCGQSASSTTTATNGSYNTGRVFSCYTAWQVTLSKPNCTTFTTDVTQPPGGAANNNMLNRNFTITCAQQTDIASCSITSAPTSVLPGASFSVVVSVTNSGTTTWTSAEGYSLGSADPRDASIWGINRTSVGTIAPGGNTSLTFTRTAPNTPGSYTFARQMLREGVAWFGNVCSTTITVAVADPPPDPPVPVGVNCESYPPNTLNFNTVQRVNLPRSAPGGQGHETDAWQVSNTGPTSAPSFGGAVAGGNLVLNSTTQTRQVTRTVSYSRTVTLTQVYRFPTSPAQTTIDTIVDEWGENLPIPPLRLDGNNHYIFLDYKTHFDNYPYDTHTPRITYRIGYQRLRRVGTITQTSTVTQYGTNTRTKAATSTTWGPYQGIVWGPVPGPSFSAPSSPSAISTQDDTSYTGRVAAPSFAMSGALPAVTAPTMPPCYPRNFSANPSAVNAALNPNPESPTDSTFSFSIPTTLTISNGGALRTPTSITGSGIPYEVSWNAVGYSGPSYSGSSAGSFTVPNTSLASSVTVPGTTFSSSIGVSIPANIRAGDQICWTITVNEPIGTVKVGGEIWQRQGPPRSSSACTVYAYDQPYSRFYGADVFGGGGFSSTDDTCTAINPDAIALGPMRFDTDTNLYAGTGAQLAVFAIQQINGVQPLSRTTRPPLQLAFSNQSQPPFISVTGNQFGGGFGSVTCAENYFAGIPDNTSWVPTNNVDISGLASGRYYYEGDVSIYGQLPDDATEGRRVVIYVDGNVSLRADSTAAGTGKVGYANNTEWTSLELIPSLYVIANGNIFIDDGVTELDGAYVSQGGEIFTCAIGFDAPTVAQLTEQCRTQLQVNGTFLANKVNLWRTFGSLRESYPLEVPVRDPTPADPAPTDPPSSRAAEIFIYNPTLWFTEGGNLPSNSKIQIDSYTTLSPSL
jgi:hypothetical protein